jgi:Flp pilus assembly protein TadB
MWLKLRAGIAVFSVTVTICSSGGGNLCNILLLASSITKERHRFRAFENCLILNA